MTKTLYGLVKDCLDEDSRILFWSYSFQTVHDALLNHIQNQDQDSLSVVPIA